MIIKDINNPHEVQVIQGDRSTTVKMRQHNTNSSPKTQLSQLTSSAVPGSPASQGAKRKQMQYAKIEKSRNSPSESSEAYGTGY